MGVYHLSGLGLNAGAITAPLTYVYLMHKASRYNEKAREFFETSGERGQTDPGVPEAIILFTSKDVIEGNKGIPGTDSWFSTRITANIGESINNYLEKMLKEYGYNEIKYKYMIEVKHEDFYDCFKKIYLTLNGLKNKEMWINMTGGTNQINSSLLIASGLQGVSARYYYFFQNQTKLMHPDMERPNIENLKIEKLSKYWFELPIIWIDIEKLFDKLKERFKYSDIINKGELMEMLSEIGESNQNSTMLIKLIGSRIIKKAGNDTFKEGEMLKNWYKILEQLKDESKKINNFTEWKKWAEEYKILKEF